MLATLSTPLLKTTLPRLAVPLAINRLNRNIRIIIYIYIYIYIYIFFFFFLLLFFLIEIIITQQKNFFFFGINKFRKLLNFKK